jgi:hypothetical protein
MVIQDPLLTSGIMFYLLELSPRDMTTAMAMCISEGGSKELIVTSAYLPYDTDEPSSTKKSRTVTAAL